MIYRYLLAAWLVLTGAPALAADDAGTRAGVAVSTILFEYDGDDFATFLVQDDGFVDITFAMNTPEPLYVEILNRLKSHPDIKGVLAGKGGPVCSRF